MTLPLYLQHLSFPYYYLLLITITIYVCFIHIVFVVIITRAYLNSALSQNEKKRKCRIERWILKFYGLKKVKKKLATK